MQNLEIIQQILESVHSDECEVLGKEAVRGVIESAISTSSSNYKIHGGHDFDLTPIVEFLESGTVIIVNAVAIYSVLKGRFKRRPTALELEEELIDSLKDKNISIDNDNISKIADLVAKVQKDS